MWSLHFLSVHMWTWTGRIMKGIRLSWLLHKQVRGVTAIHLLNAIKLRSITPSTLPVTEVVRDLFLSIMTYPGERDYWKKIVRQCLGLVWWLLIGWQIWMWACKKGSKWLESGIHWKIQFKNTWIRKKIPYSKNEWSTRYTEYHKLVPVSKHLATPVRDTFKNLLFDG